METYRMSHDGVDYLAKRIHADKDFEVLAAGFWKSMDEGNSISKTEFQTIENLIAKLKANPTFHLYKVKDMQLCAGFMMIPSPLVRSTNPYYVGGYINVFPKHRSKNLALAATELGKRIAIKHGHGGVVSRVAVLSRFVGPSILMGNILLGTIPNSLKVARYGWVDDAVNVSLWDPCEGKYNPIPKETYEIEPLNRDPVKVASLNIPWPTAVPQLPHLSWRGMRLSVQPPSVDEALQVEEMFREAAKEGQGFAIDEFNTDGFLNRTLFHHAHMAVVKASADGAIKAGLIFGPSSVCRDMTTPQAACYMVVKKSERGKGLGTVLLEYGIENMRAFDYSAVLTDVFVSCEGMVRMLHRSGFIATTSFPNSGVVVGHGRTNTLLMYKPIINIKSSLSKM